MFKEYPKALYSGDTFNNDMTVADDAEHEAILREQGYVDFADLPEYQADLQNIGDVSPNQDVVPQAVYDQVYQDRERVEQERDTALSRITELEQIIKNGIAENEQLRQQVAQYQSLGEQPVTVDYSNWTADQLRDEITKQGKTFKARDSKAELIAILEA